MFHKTDVIRSTLNPTMLAKGEFGILHLYANDKKMILVLEKLEDNKYHYIVKEVNILYAPSRYKSDMLASDIISTHNSDSINEVISDMERRCSIVLSPLNNYKAVHDKISTNIDPKDSRYDLLLNPGRQEYLTRLFSDCSEFADSLALLISSASRKQEGGCTIL